MSRKRPGQMIGRLSELLISGNRAGLPTELISKSPNSRSPRLECRIHSPRGVPKNYDLSGGVGLGIVAALEKSCGRSTTRSDPIPVGPCKNYFRNDRVGGGDGVDEESFTYVTSHRPDDKSFTKVYYDAGEYGKVVSPLPKVNLPPKSLEVAVHDYPTSGFLNSCNLCKKKLHGKDIYMYRGEKAFCSAECRSRQIMVDEHREQCRSEVVPRSADVSSSPYTASPIFSAGILAI